MSELIEHDADELSDARNKRAARKESLQSREDMSLLLNTPAFRRYIISLFNFCGESRISYISQNADGTAFNEGMRNVAQKIKADMADVSPTAFAQLIIDTTASEPTPEE